MTAAVAELSFPDLTSPFGLAARLSAARADREEEARLTAAAEYDEAVQLVESVLGHTVFQPSVVPLKVNNSLCRTRGCKRTARMLVVVPGELATECCAQCAAQVRRGR